MIAGFSLFALVIAAFVLLTILMGVRQVPQGWNYTVERFGKYRKTLTPGLGFIMPYVDSVGRKLNVMEQVIDVPSQEIITKDNASVKVDGVAFYQVLDPRRASYEVSNLQEALLNLVMTNIRTAMGSMDLDQLLFIATRSTCACSPSSTRPRTPGASRSPASRSRTSSRPGI